MIDTEEASNEDVQARRSTQIITQRIQQLDSYKDAINKKLETAFTDLIKSKQKLTRVSTVLELVQENMGNLRLSTKGLFANNKHRMFIIDKALEILKHNFSSENLIDFIQYCKKFEVDDPKIYMSISNIIQRKQEETPTLELRLKLMTEFEQSFPLVQLEELFPLSSLGPAESIYLLYIIKTQRKIESKDEDENKSETIYDIDQIELQNKVINHINEVVINGDLDCLHALFVGLAHIKETEIKDPKSVNEQIDNIASKIEEKISEITVNKLFTIHSATQKLLYKAHGDKVKSLSTQTANLLKEKIPEMSHKELEDLTVTIYKSQGLSDQIEESETLNKELFEILCKNELPVKLKEMNITPSFLSIDDKSLYKI